jgi:hypothetical protein
MVVDGAFSSTTMINELLEEMLAIGDDAAGVEQPQYFGVVGLVLPMVRHRESMRNT